MHRTLAMNTDDLAELYWLLHMYQRTHESPAAQDTLCLLKRIRALYGEQASLANRPSTLPPRHHNPRGAGRKRHYSEGIAEQIINLRTSGNSIRAIASKIPCSVGHVHKIINEHNKTQATQ